MTITNHVSALQIQEMKHLFIYFTNLQSLPKMRGKPHRANASLRRPNLHDQSTVHTNIKEKLDHAHTN